MSHCRKSLASLCLALACLLAMLSSSCKAEVGGVELGRRATERGTRLAPVLVPPRVPFGAVEGATGGGVCDSDCLASQRQSESACYDLYYFDFNSSWTEHALYIAVPLEQALLACAVESEACTSAVDAAVTKLSDGVPWAITSLLREADSLFCTAALASMSLDLQAVVEAAVQDACPQRTQQHLDGPLSDLKAAVELATDGLLFTKSDSVLFEDTPLLEWLQYETATQNTSLQRLLSDASSTIEQAMTPPVREALQVLTQLCSG